MSKCSYGSGAQAPTQRECDPSTKEPVPFSEKESSPLYRALRAHFQAYAGLTEPKVDTLRPQVDDI